MPTHILIDATLERFGYDPRILKPSSERLVVTVCVECGTERDKKFRYACTQYRCIHCSNRINACNSRELRSERMKQYYASGGKHPLAGAGHSEETKRKISEGQRGRPSAITPEGRQRLAEHCMRILNNPVTKERTRRLNRGRTGAKSWSYGKTPPHTRKVWHDRLDGARVCFRSTWEAAFARYLDGQGIAWEYEAFTFPVSYELSGEQVEGTYTPDFKTADRWYEVKGRWTAEGRAKFEAFREQYPEYGIEVIDRAWLKSQGILPKR